MLPSQMYTKTPKWAERKMENENSKNDIVTQQWEWVLSIKNKWMNDDEMHCSIGLVHFYWADEYATDCLATFFSTLYCFSFFCAINIVFLFALFVAHNAIKVSKERRQQQNGNDKISIWEIQFVIDARHSCGTKRGMQTATGEFRVRSRTNIMCR